MILVASLALAGMGYEQLEISMFLASVAYRKLQQKLCAISNIVVEVCRSEMYS